MDFQIDKIYNEDCLEGMKRIADGAVDCIITDLPYGVLNEQSEGGSWDSIIPLEPMWEQFKRVTKPNAAIVLFCQGMFTAKLMMSQPKMWRYNLIWDKSLKSGFLNANRMPLRQHEDIAVFYGELPTYNPQMIKVPPHKRNHSKGNMAAPTQNRCYGKFVETPTIISDEKYPSSIVSFAKEHINGKAYHPTEKPVDLLRYLILTYSNEGDTILDATIGSGTTAVAALMEKRHFIGFETNREYFDIAQGRIDQVLRNPTLF
jgi:DNA modification methylase